MAKRNQKNQQQQPHQAPTQTPAPYNHHAAHNQPSQFPPGQQYYVNPPASMYSAPPPPPPTSSHVALNNSTQQVVDRSTDKCLRVGGFVLLAIVLAGFSFCIMTISSCAFLSVAIPRQIVEQAFNNASNTTTLPPMINGGRDLQLVEDNSTTTMSPAPSSSPTSLEESLITLSFGLFTYQDPVAILNNESPVCVVYAQSNNTDPPDNIRLARLGILVALFSSGIASLIIAIEFTFCRVYCSRVFINMGLVLAMLGIPLTFVVFADGRCSPLVQKPQDADVVGGCALNDGAQDALISLILLFAALVLACVLPKPLPLIRVIQEMERNRRFAFCCYCFDDWRCPQIACCCRRRNKKNNAKAYNDEEEEKEDIIDGDHDMELTVPLTMGENVMDELGHCYKQYHDETAGYTLQNQYTAAYKRWLACEADYEETLGRFKNECTDADVNWREFLHKAKQKQHPQNAFAENRHLHRQLTTSTYETAQSVPDDEVMNEKDVFDDELWRFVDVLTTLRENCNFAKEVMSRIQNDIHELTKLEDERHKAAIAASFVASKSQTRKSQRKPSPTKQEQKPLVDHSFKIVQAEVGVSFGGEDDNNSGAFYSTLELEEFDVPQSVAANDGQICTAMNSDNNSNVGTHHTYDESPTITGTSTTNPSSFRNASDESSKDNDHSNNN